MTVVLYKVHIRHFRHSSTAYVTSPCAHAHFYLCWCKPWKVAEENRENSSFMYF